ncbi:MAG: 1,3-beta-galactosyl-N-acetylhexosamine phosphorylase [Clostridia bacterium]|nr:1,3-beta-galactosyl-N-acetylhexosamine phosphorylase [Clostridia bacterium]
MKKGGFTLPGEAGYEKLTLELCEKWGADCIRDSDGTVLSDEILSSGIPIYSTICLVRSINGWAKENPDKLQRCFLSSDPKLATGKTLEIYPLEKYFRPQMTIWQGDDKKKLWEVWDRTSGEQIDKEKWSWDEERGVVIINETIPYHFYTVSFMATRVWEEISMYNHITNDWGDRERLMAVEPRYPETQEALLSYLDEWCRSHPATKVVRFTSLFYNFTWIWGADERHRSMYTDWGSYDFAVNPPALDEFEAEYSYRLTAEDFINMGRRNPTHNPPTKHYRDWMEFTGKFVRAFGKKCIDIVHSYGKLAYMFYDDTWIGTEPWSGYYGEFGFDGLIKCVFNAFEARLCAGVKEVKTHELRLHPYLFPTGLGGEPTFAPGGHPERDAKRFWACVRRALLRVKIDRIGLGGYLSLTEPFPEFRDEIEHIADEFRTLRDLHESDSPWSTEIHVAVLHSWGSLRTWNCAGHMHEHPELPLNHIYEALAGQPFEVSAISFEEVEKNGVPEDVDVIINAGREGDAWSGGEAWKSTALKAAICEFMARGGGFIGVSEPSALRCGGRHFRLADIFGTDREVGATICHEKYKYERKPHFITAEMTKEERRGVRFHNHTPGVYALSGDADIILSDEATGDIIMSAREFEAGRAVYMSGFTYSSEYARLLYRSLLYAAGREELESSYMAKSPYVECAYFPKSGTLVAINSSKVDVATEIKTPNGSIPVNVSGEGTVILKLS